MNFDELSPDLKDKARACTSIDELVQLAKDEGIELNKEQVDSVTGGWAGCHDDCGSESWHDWWMRTQCPNDTPEWYQDPNNCPGFGLTDAW